MKVVSHIEEFFKIFYLVFNPFVDLAMKNGHTKIADILKKEEKRTEVANYTTCVDFTFLKNMGPILIFMVFSSSSVQSKMIPLFMHFTLQPKMVNCAVLFYQMID